MKTFTEKFGESAGKLLDLTALQRSTDLRGANRITALPTALLGAEVTGIDIVRNRRGAGNFPSLITGHRLTTLSMRAVLCLVFAQFASAQDVLTFHNDVFRSGVQISEKILTPYNISPYSFGKVRSFPVDGDVYAQPLYVSNYVMADGKTHNVLFVATAHDLIYAFDADGNNPSSGFLWSVSLLGADETWVSSNDVNTTDIDPDIGVVGTPTINRTYGILYVVAKSKTTTATPQFIQRLHALMLSTGKEILGGPTVISATLPGVGNGGSNVSFDPLLNNQRAALLLAPTPNATKPDSVFIAWASHGDNGNYHGWVLSYNFANISQQTGAWVDTPNGSQGGIWMSGGGLSTDGEGGIYGGSGNGSFDGASDFADTLFKLNASDTGSGLTLSDWFTPWNQLSLSQADEDFGVGGAPLVLPTQTGPVPHLIVTADKTGQIYILNRDDLGHSGTNTNPDVQDFSDGGFQVHSNLVFFENSLYLAPDGGPLQQYLFNPKVGKFATSPITVSTHIFGCVGCQDGQGSNFTISSNAGKDAIVWAIDYSAFGSGPAVLYAFAAHDLAIELYSSALAGTRDEATIAVKFAAPTVANGLVFVGGGNAVTVYGLL
jgi:hypothetical protein